MNMNADIALNVINEGINQKEKEDLYMAWLHSPIRFEKSFDEYYESCKTRYYRKSTEEEKEEILKEYGGA